MADFASFAKYEHEIIPQYRDQLNHAESVEDVRKFFVYAVRTLFKHVFDNRMSVDYEDIELKPDAATPFFISAELRKRDGFGEAWRSSDLKHIVKRLAHSATHRYRHLETSPEKTRSKIKRH